MLRYFHNPDEKFQICTLPAHLQFRINYLDLLHSDTNIANGDGHILAS